MAEDEARRSMSIIPYATNRDIVLRHNDAIVVYDRSSKQLVLRNASQSNHVDLADCPYCHRPMRDDTRDSGRERGSSPGAQAGFVNPEYFRMLHNSLPGSAESSAPPSPRRRLVQPVRSETASPARPPPSAEFVGSSPASPPAAHGISSTAFSPNYFQKFFVEEGELGRGGRGVVLLVKHVLDGVSLGHFACKRVPVGDDHEWLEKVLIEVQLLQHLSHQNLVSYRHVWLEDVKLSTFSPSVPCAFILQQYCNAGDLHNYICNTANSNTTTQQLKDRIRRRSKGQPEPPRDLYEPRKLHFEDIYSLFKDITSGLRYLHANGFIHRDLKPSNCLLHETGHELRVLVSDFGEVQTEKSVRKSTGATGTISYCAPEVLRRVSPDGPFGNFTLKSDIFSLGMILYFLCFAQLPYRNADLIHEEKEDLDLLRTEISQWAGFDDERRMRPDLPEKLYTFLNRLLSVNPDDRPTADDISIGIRTGAGLEENVQPRRTNRSSSINGPFDDLRPGHRIVPVDSPAPATPPSRSPTRNAAQTTALARPRISKLRPISFSRDRSEHADDHDHNHDYEDENDRTPSLSPNHDLILRPKFPSSPTRTPSPPPHSPQLLPPPPAPTLISRLQQLRHLLLFASPIPQTFLLIAKIISLIQPCAPNGLNPWFAYPLLCLAVLDFGFRDDRFHALTLAVHVVGVGLGLRWGLLCLARGGGGIEWENVGEGGFPG